MFKKNLCPPFLLLFAMLVGCGQSEQQGLNEYNDGVERMDDQQWDAAIACFGRAMGKKSEFHDAYFRRGLAFYYKKQYPTAIEDMNQAIHIKENHHHYHVGRGIAKLCNRDFDAAIHDFDHVIQNNAKQDLQDVAERMKTVARQAKATKRRNVSNSTNKPLVLPPAPEPPEKTFWKYGLLGNSGFFKNNTTWAIVAYLVAYFIGFCIVQAMVVGTHKQLSDQAKGVCVILGLLFGVGFYFVAWGYDYWGWWIASAVVSFLWSGAVIKDK